jgi:hypothetical protein
MKTKKELREERERELKQAICQEKFNKQFKPIILEYVTEKELRIVSDVIKRLLSLELIYRNYRVRNAYGCNMTGFSDHLLNKFFSAKDEKREYLRLKKKFEK